MHSDNRDITQQLPLLLDDVEYVVALLPDAHTRGRCQADRVYDYFNDTPDHDRQCKLSAKILINGKRLCKRHAGVEALDILSKRSN